MAALLFPDNTVLVNFATVGRMDVLEHLVRGRAAWTATVAEECRRSAQIDGLAELGRMPQVFGEPLVLATPQEIVNTEAIRGRMIAPGDPITAHLGEAEAVAIITTRGLRAAFVTDDRQAGVVARAHGVKTYSTCVLIKLAVRVGLLTADDAWQIVTLLRRRSRHLHDSPRERHTYMMWIAEKTG
jgi:predicted nucleic acid-binding protein